MIKKGWFTIERLASMRLPGMPATGQGVRNRARVEAWLRPEWQGSHWRPRRGRGGGVEFHWSLLPPEARAHLVATAPELLPTQRKSVPAPDAGVEAWWASRPAELRHLARNADGPVIVQLLVVLLRGDRQALRDCAAILQRLADTAHD